MGRDKKAFWQRRASVIKAHMLLLAHLERMGPEVPTQLQVRRGCSPACGGRVALSASLHAGNCGLLSNAGRVVAQADIPPPHLFPLPLCHNRLI